MSGPATPVVLALDVGGTSFKGALVEETGRLCHEAAVPLRGRTGPAAFEALNAFCADLKTLARARSLTPIAAGIVTPGMDETTGRVMFASNLGWRDLPLRDELARRLDLPVATGHDVRAAGLAEGLLGAGGAARDFVLVMIGTGIAAALVSNGQMIAGASKRAGEFGHAPVVAGGERCACGQSGCLEAYASAASIARRYRALGGETPLSAAEIGLALSHDRLARRVWDEAIEALAVGLTTLTMLFDPALFVLGGGLVEAGSILLDPLAAALERQMAWRQAPPIRRSVLGAEAGRLGAAILAYRLAGRADVVDRWSAAPARSG